MRIHQWFSMALFPVVVIGCSSALPISTEDVKSESLADTIATPSSAPFDVSWCSGPTPTSEQVLAHFPPASTQVRLAAITVDARQRECQDQTGCGDWTPSHSIPLYEIKWGSKELPKVNVGFYYFDTPINVDVPFTDTVTNLSCAVPGPDCIVSVRYGLGFTVFTDRPYTKWHNTYRQIGNWSASPERYWGSPQMWNGNFTNSCVYAEERGRVYHDNLVRGQGELNPAGSSGLYTEYQIVAYGSF
jgi:hypothetical protein